MKPIWKGAISFGMVTIPVKLYKATEERTLRFHQLHDADSGRIRYKRVCSTCDQEVSQDTIVRGYEYDQGRHVVVADHEIERGMASAREISITRFVAEDEVDALHLNAAYYLGPDQVGLKGYRLLHAAMHQQRRAALATVTMREKEHPVLLRQLDEVIVLTTMFWPDEIRKPALDYLDVDAELRTQEIEMACALVENLAGPFDPSEFHDTHRERLEALIAAKIEGIEPLPAPVETTSKVLDLMEALKASVQATTATDAPGRATQHA